MVKPRLLFYLKPETLEVYSDQTSGAARLDFPPEVVSHQEILSEEKFSRVLENFVSEMGVADLEAVILISPPLIYKKEFPYDQSSTNQDPGKPLLDLNVLNTKIQEFVDTSPFENNQIARLELKGESSSLVLVTNKALYEKIVDVITKLGDRVLSVVPVTVFEELSQKQPLESDDVGLVFSDKKILQANNFLLSQSITNPVVKTDLEEDEDNEEGSDKKQKFLLIFGIIFILAGIIVLALMLGFLKNPLSPEKKANTPAQIQSTPSPSTAVSLVGGPTVIATSSAFEEIKKENLKVEITNGTGVVGQGGRVQTILAGLGYRDINISGISISGTTDTLIDFKNNVAITTRNELVTELEKTFLSVKFKEASPSAQFDIAIITGVNK